MQADTIQKQSAKLFFDVRASQVQDNPDLAALCWVSGKEPRLWTQPSFYNDVMMAIKQQLELSSAHSLLEVGCAAGLLAKGLATMCSTYSGVDIAKAAIEKARTLDLPNASFSAADAVALPFPDAAFDRVLCMDVFTNFDSFAKVEPILTEMIRVVRPRGLVMIGSVPDAARKRDYPARIAEVNGQLDKMSGPMQNTLQKPLGLRKRLWQWYLRTFHRIEPQITCYYFCKQQFIDFGVQRHLSSDIKELSPNHPYYGFRFNVVYAKRAS